MLARAYIVNLPLVFPAKSAGGKSQLCSKEPSPENFLTIGGCFECNTSCVKVLGWLEKKKEEDDDDEQFRVSTFSGLPL